MKREGAGERRSQATEPVLHLRNLQECSNHTRESTRTHTHTHTHATVTGSSKSFKRFRERQRHFHTSTSQHAGARRIRQDQTAETRRETLGERGIDCVKQPRAQLEGTQSLPPGFHFVSKAFLNQHTCTHTHIHQATPPTILPSSLSALSRHVGLLMPPPGRLNDSNVSPRREWQTARGLPQPGYRVSPTGKTSAGM